MSSFYYTDEHKEIEFVYSKDSKTEYEKHNHISMFIFGLVLKGKIEICKEDSSVICEAEDMIIIMPYELHSIKVLDTSYSMLTLCMKDEIILAQSFTEIMKLLRQYGSGFINDQIITELQLEAYLDAVEMIYEMNYTPHKAKQTERLKNLIISEPENELRLQAMAASIYINKYYMIRKFKEEVGLTPHHFLLQNRIRKAKYLIQEGEKIANAAINCGFYDQSHFVKYFKKYVGMPPIEYEKSLIKL